VGHVESSAESDFNDVTDESQADSVANLTYSFAAHDLVLKSRKDLFLVQAHIDFLFAPDICPRPTY
jgi:hypothetical protein